MPSNFPINLDELTNGMGGSPLNNPDHTIIHNDVNDAIKKLEIKVGIDNSTDPDSLDNKIKNIPAGPQGPQGEKGESGDKGDKGENGEQGLKGDTGDTGLQGEQGIQGIQGEIGLKGNTGSQGVKGDTGDTGPQGQQGIQGEQGQAGISNYIINVQALTSSPADGATIYFGMLPKAPATSANISKVYIRKAGTIKIAEIYCYSGTAGTNEAWSLYIRKNNSADTLIATLSVNTNERVFSNTGLSIPVAVGDYIEIKSVNPTWSTNPLTCIFGGYIYIE